MKRLVLRRPPLKSARRARAAEPPCDMLPAPAADAEEALYGAMERALGFLHGRRASNAFMAKLRRRFPAPQYFMESSRQVLERTGFGEGDAFYFTLIPALTGTCMSQRWGVHPLLNRLWLMRDYLKTLYLGIHVECFYLILLDRQGRLIRPVLLQQGGVDNTPFYLRQLLIPVLDTQARYIVLAHNHPRGTLRPSDADLRCTLHTLEAFTPLRILLLDHLIVAGEAVVSIRDGELLPEMLWTSAQPDDPVVRDWLDNSLINS